MSNYNHPSQAIAEYLLEEGLVNQGSVFVDFHPDLSTISTDFITLVRMVAAVPNPRWARDNITVTIQVAGQKQQNLIQCRNHIWEVFNKLLGSPNLDLDGYTYFQFTSQEMPNLVGYLENGQPLYTASVSFVREAQTKEGNRDVIC